MSTPMLGRERFKEALHLFADGCGSGRAGGNGRDRVNGVLRHLLNNHRSYRSGGSEQAIHQDFENQLFHKILVVVHDLGLLVRS